MANWLANHSGATTALKQCMCNCSRIQKHNRAQWMETKI